MKLSKIFTIIILIILVSISAFSCMQSEEKLYKIITYKEAWHLDDDSPFYDKDNPFAVIILLKSLRRIELIMQLR